MDDDYDDVDDGGDDNAHATDTAANDDTQRNGAGKHNGTATTPNIHDNDDDVDDKPRRRVSAGRVACMCVLNAFVCSTRVRRRRHLVHHR
jgi:hypothetical protein